MDPIEELLAFIKESPSPFHVVASGARRLQAAGFQELDMGTVWAVRPGGRYFVPVYGSTLLAFCIGSQPGPLRMAAAHTDFPCWRVKPAAGMVQDGYGQLNVESYGGLILSSWLDRPLSLAGRVVLRGPDAFSPVVRLLDTARPLVTIPGLAIHMNRKVNEGVALNRQKDMLPLAALLGKEAKADANVFFVEWLARELAVQPEDILSYELTLYPAEFGCRLGLDGRLVSSSRLDNLTSVKACLDGILSVPSAGLQGIRLAAFFDNEEVGSATKQGAGSAVLMQVLERIFSGLGRSRSELLASIGRGFLLSVDVAHGLHPNAPEKNDPTNRPVLGGGVVLKQAASQSYASDAEAVAVVSELCRQHQIPWQCFVNRSDQRGGSTLGSIVSALVPVRTMDIGVPLLAMHSACETMGADDQQALTALIQVFLAAVQD